VVTQLREHRPLYQSWVTGQAAGLIDFTASLAARAPYAAALIVIGTFVLLFLMTGSVVIPTKALLLNVLSLGASLGVATWIFQEGHLQGLLGFTSTGALESMIPPLALTFGFGLSMDYELFLISRIAELYHHNGHDNDRAVELGLQRSGRIITSAALLVVIVFAGFIAGKMLVIKQIGLASTPASLRCAAVIGAGAGQRVEAAAGLGEGDDVADRLGVREQHDDPVPAEGDAAVRRGAELEGVEQEAELLLRLLRDMPMTAKTRSWTSLTVDTDRAAADLVAVAHHVVGVGQRRARVGVEGVEELGLGEVKAWCTAVQAPPPTATSPAATASTGRLEQRRVDDPQEGPGRLVDQPDRGADLRRAAPSSARTPWPAPAAKKMQSPGLAPTWAARPAARRRRCSWPPARRARRPRRP
jgi:hypothetical protein